MFDDNSDKQPKVEPQKDSGPKLESKPTETVKSSEPSGVSKDSVHTMPMEYYLGDKTVAAVKKAKAQPQRQEQNPQMANTVVKKRPKALVIGVVVVLVLMVLGSGYLLYATYFGGDEDVEDIKNNTDIPSYAETTDGRQMNTDNTDENNNKAEKDENNESEDDLDSEVLNPREQGRQVQDDDRLDLTVVREKNLSDLSSLDTDRDGLTDVEEEMIGSDPALLDTDKDGFNDRQEVINLYSPVSIAEFGVVRLYDLEFADLYVNEKLSYKIYYPKDWVIDSIDEDNPVDVMLTSNVNEFINIVVYEKPVNESLKNWYLKQNPNARERDIRDYKTYNDLDAIESPDGFTVFVAMENDVLAINYSIGLKDEAMYPNIFKMVVNSLEFLTAAELADLIEEMTPVVEIIEDEPEEEGVQFLEAETLGEE